MILFYFFIWLVILRHIVSIYQLVFKFLIVGVCHHYWLDVTVFIFQLFPLPLRESFIVVQAGRELTRLELVKIVLLQPPKSWDYRYELPHSARYHF